MPASAIYQILQKHLVHGNVRPGEEIGVRVDQMLCTDGVGTMVFLHLERLGKSRVQGKRAVCYVDHDIVQDCPENAEIFRFLQSACARFKIQLSRPGHGIGSLVHLERFSAPGQLLLGANSHITTAGGMGTLALGVGAIDLAAALIGAPYYFLCPAVVRVVLSGALRPWCSAHDVVLHLLARLGSKNNSGIALEFCGRGVKSLSLGDRATIAGLGAEMGVQTSLFPADEVTRAFLVAQGRGREFLRVNAGDGPDYADEIEVDLSGIVPLVALPHGAERLVPVKDVAGLGVQQVAIGGCTGGFLEDLARVAALLRRHRVHPEVSLLLAPSTRQVLRTLAEHKLLQGLLDAGARLVEPSCGSCLGHGQGALGDWVTVRTGSRADSGSCGTPGGEVYLVSPETAAATAVRGVLSDPRDLKLPAPKVQPPRRFTTEDGFILFPGRKGKGEILRGPHIVDPPLFGSLPGSLPGEAVLKLGDNLTTDQILPSTGSSKVHSNIQEYARHTFERIDPLFLRRAEENQGRAICNILVAGHGYGQGPDQEYAAMCPMVLGVRVILAKSFERVHVPNLVNQGIIPLTFLDDRSYELVHRDDFLELPWVAAEMKKSEMVTVRNPEKGYEFKVKHGFTRRQIDILMAGGLFNYVAG